MVKLIKLQGDSDKSDIRIRNIFNEGIIIPPNSKIGLRSCRVNFLNIKDFESFTLPEDTVIELDYHVGDPTGPMFVQKVVVPTIDSSGAQIKYESSTQLLGALSKQSNATYTDPNPSENYFMKKYQGFHNIWDLTQGSLQAGRSEFVTYSIADKAIGFAAGANGEFVQKSPNDATNITLANGEIGITATTASPLSADLNVEGLQSVPLVNTVLLGTMQELPANDPATGDDCFKFAAKKGSGDLSSHPALWGWGISKDHNLDRRYALWVNDVKYFFPDADTIVPQVYDTIQCRKYGEKVRLEVIRGGTGLPVALAADPLTTNGGTEDITITVPTGSGAHAGNPVILSGFPDIPRPVQSLATDGVATAATIVNGAADGISMTQAQADPIVTVTTATAHSMTTGDTFTLNGVKGTEADLIANGVEVLTFGANASIGVTTATAHGLVVGDTFTMSGVTPPAGGPQTIGGIPIADFNGPIYTVDTVTSVTEIKYFMGKTSSDLERSGLGGKINHNNVGGVPIAQFAAFAGTVLAAPPSTATTFSYTMTGSTSTVIETGGGSDISITTTQSNQEPLTLTFVDAHDMLPGDTFTMIPSVAVDGVAIAAGSLHTVQLAPSATTITINMPAGQTATNGGITGGGAAMTIQASAGLISASFLNDIHLITGNPTATTITIDASTVLEFTTTGGGSSATAIFQENIIGQMVSGSTTSVAQSGIVPSLTSDSLDPQIVRWQVTADKDCGFKVDKMEYQASAGFGQSTAVGLTINTSLAFPRDNPIGSYIGFVDTLYSNIGAPSIITSDQTAIGRNTYPAILVQSLKGLDLNSYAGKQDAPNKPISFFDVIVPQSVSTISNMLYEPNNIAMLDLHNARPIELKDMEIQFARDDTGNPLRFFGQPTVVLELDEGV